MVNGIIEVIRKIAEAEVKKMHIMELAIVLTVYPHSTQNDKENYECNIKLKDKDVELKRVPVATQHIGLSNILHVNDLVLVSFINGDINSPIIIGRLYNDEDRPPLSKMEEIIYRPPYTIKNDLKRLQIVLPGGTVNITAHDDKIDIHVGKSSIHADSKGNILLDSVKDENPPKGSQVLIDNSKVEVLSGVSEPGPSANNCHLQMNNDGTMFLQTSNGGKESLISIGSKNNGEGSEMLIQTKLPLKVKSEEKIDFSSEDINLEATNVKITAKKYFNVKADQVIIKGNTIEMDGLQPSEGGDQGTIYIRSPDRLILVGLKRVDINPSAYTSFGW